MYLLKNQSNQAQLLITKTKLWILLLLGSAFTCKKTKSKAAVLVMLICKVRR